MKNLIILLLCSLYSCHQGDTKSPCSVLADMTIEDQTLRSDLDAMQFVWLEGEGDIDPLPIETRSSNYEEPKSIWWRVLGGIVLTFLIIFTCASVICFFYFARPIFSTI